MWSSYKLSDPKLLLQLNAIFRPWRKTLLAMVIVPLLIVSPRGVHGLEQHTEIIPQTQWPQYVNGTNLLALPQVSTVLMRFEENQNVSVLILYPNTDLGQGWAKTLRNWLVSFGVPGSHLGTAPAIDNSNQLVITLTNQ